MGVGAVQLKKGGLEVKVKIKKRFLISQFNEHGNYFHGGDELMEIDAELAPNGGRHLCQGRKPEDTE